MTGRPPPEVADVFRQYADPYLSRFGASPAQRRVLRDVQACRTAALGGHVDACDRCGHEAISYNSCRNRHCPKCQGPARARWLDARAAELLPVPYFHVVFTLPGVLAPLARQNPAVVYDALFASVAATLSEVATNPKHLGARVGFLAVLHTWGQNLMHHPHVHCVVPAGGLSPDGTKWVHGRADFFLPVRVLGRVFRGKFIGLLKAAFGRGRLEFHGDLKPLGTRAAIERLLDESVRNEWVVYAKPPFGGPGQVLKYLARYTHRVAISNGRMLGLADGKVTFRWKDHAHGGRKGTMTLEATEFIRRFLMHVMPPGFVRLRYYGFMANRRRAENLAECRRLLGHRMAPEARDGVEADRPAAGAAAGTAAGTAAGPSADGGPDRCRPLCRQGRMQIVGLLERRRAPHAPALVRTPVVYQDTS